MPSKGSVCLCVCSLCVCVSAGAVGDAACVVGRHRGKTRAKSSVEREAMYFYRVFLSFRSLGFFYLSFLSCRLVLSVSLFVSLFTYLLDIIACFALLPSLPPLCLCLCLCASTPTSSLLRQLRIRYHV